MNKMRQWHLLPHHLQMWQGGSFQNSEAERKALSLTGSPLALETFRPHITIGNLRSAELISAVRDDLAATNVRPKTFEATQLHITDIGSFGTITKDLTEAIPLQK